MAGKCAFNLCDFDKAVKYLKTAQEGSALDGRADGYLQNIAAYKTLWKKEQEIRAKEEKDASDPAKALPRVVLKTNEGDIVLELFENEAPQTVGNFVNLIEKGFYNGYAGKRVVFGHTHTRDLPQELRRFPDACPKESDRVWLRGDLVGIDTGCGRAGVLTAVELPSLRIIDSR